MMTFVPTGQSVWTEVRVELNEIDNALAALMGTAGTEGGHYTVRFHNRTGEVLDDFENLVAFIRYAMPVSIAESIVGINLLDDRCISAHSHIVFAFENEQDAVMFKLRYEPR